LLVNHVKGGFPVFQTESPEVLNTFAYTCSFSVCAAKAGAKVTSIDLSKKYLDWGRDNFSLNDLPPDHHDFLYGDVFNWMKRFERKGRRFDLILLDPPSFSQSQEHGIFRAEKDYPMLVRLAACLLKSSAVLFASTNAGAVRPETFLDVVTATLRQSGRRVLDHHYAPQPPDFPINRAEPAHLKTLWVRVG
jgi:23S rRNA (cytosine1962-C5)-methyltransferase